jgi:hypothetical protein
MWIIVAKTETQVEVVRQRRIDLGEKPITREVTVGKAAVWKADGTKAEVAKAKLWASKEGDGWMVFTYPITNDDPLGCARKDVVKAARKNA